MLPQAALRPARTVQARTIRGDTCAQAWNRAALKPQAANILNLMVMPMANTPKRTNVTMHLT